MLTITDLDSFYGRSHVLHGVSLDVVRGSITVLLGRNGTGKTTLLKSLMGLTDRTRGRISFLNDDIEQLTAFRRARAGIAYVPQGREIIPDFTVRENIVMGTYARTDGLRRIPEFVGDLFPYLMNNLNRPGGLLSGGQQQQLAIARALAAGPKLLLLDEPTEGIQPNIVAEIEDLIISLKKNAGLTILLAEQNIDFTRSGGDYFAMLEKGQVVSHGPTSGLTDELIHRHLAI